MTSGVYERAKQTAKLGQNVARYFLAEVELKHKQEGISCLTRRFCTLAKARAWVTERSSKPDCTGITAIYEIEPIEKGKILKQLMEKS